jgi:tetraacyldisaccharide 4'-kinase
MRQTWRHWIESTETFVLEVIFEQRRGKRAAALRFLLFLLSKLFQLAVRARLLLYNARILRDSTLGVQVIAIGNLTVGGTGKTPVVEKFARELKDQGRNVAILGPSRRRCDAASWTSCCCGRMRPLRGWSRTASRFSWIRKRPATSRTCWLPT